MKNKIINQVVDMTPNIDIIKDFSKLQSEAKELGRSNLKLAHQIIELKEREEILIAELEKVSDALQNSNIFEVRQVCAEAEEMLDKYKEDYKI
jgi:hypothetical protein